MTSICICRQIFTSAVECRKANPDYEPSWEESWEKALEGISGKPKECGICIDDLEGSPLPQPKNEQGENIMTKELKNSWSPSTSTPVLPPSYFVQPGKVVTPPQPTTPAPAA